MQMLMRTMRCLVCLLVMQLVFTVGLLSAQERGTADEAKALVKKAVAYANEVGKEKALAEIGNPKGKFIYKDLYVYAGSPKNSTCLAHPMTAALVGINLNALKDADGKTFVVEMLKKKGTGVVDYRWPNPKTKKVESKSTYYEMIDSMDLLVACGYYK